MALWLKHLMYTERRPEFQSPEPAYDAHLQLQFWKVETGDPQSKLASKASHVGQLWVLLETLPQWIRWKNEQSYSWHQLWPSTCTHSCTGTHTQYMPTHAKNMCTPIYRPKKKKNKTTACTLIVLEGSLLSTLKSKYVQEDTTVGAQSLLWVPIFSRHLWNSGSCLQAIP